MKTRKFIQLIVILGAAIIGIACNLQTAGPNPSGQVLVVTATPEGPVLEPPTEGTGAQPPATATLEWTLTLTQTFTPSLTPTFTVAPVTMTAGQALSCVTGPDWKLYEWVAGIADGETVTLVARAVPEIPDYYVVRKSDGTECWAFSGSSAISGSTAGLPVRETPPLPTISFVVQNHINMQLCELLIRKAGEAAWGANRLPPPFLNIGDEFVLSITAGYYDVLVRDCFPSAVYEKYNRAIGSDNTFRILEIAVDVDFYIQNNYPFSICHIQTQAPAASWRDLYNHDTDGGPIYSGNRKDFTLRAGYYMVRVTRCTGIVLPISGMHIYPGMGGITWS